jgi:hypothetical protein
MELQAMAFHKGMPVGTMIRDWVMERLTQEKLGTADATIKALHFLDEIHVKLNCLFEGSKLQEALNSSTCEVKHEASPPEQPGHPL